METETKATHSALPWHLQEDGDVAAGKYRVARTFGGRNPLLESWGDGVLANAEYIVRACNTFPALLKAAEAAEESLSYHYDVEGRYHESGVYGRNCSICKAHDQLIAAIAAAREV